MTDLLLTPEEARAIAQTANEGDPAPREVALHWLDHIHGMLADAPELAELEPVEPDHHSDVDSRLAYGLCDDCTTDITRQLDTLRYRGQTLTPAEREHRIRRHARQRRRYYLGTLNLCRACALRRLQAGAWLEPPAEARKEAA